MTNVHRPSPVTAVAATFALVVTGSVAIMTAAAPASAAPLPASAETFAVAPSDQGASAQPFLTSDGQRVAFVSTAADLVGGDTNGRADVMLSTAATGSADPFSGEPTLISAPDGPVGAERANGDSSDPVASADGRYVAFTSTATNLVGQPSAGDGRRYVYVRDTLKNHTFRVQGSAEPDGDSYAADLDDSGTRLVLTTVASNLIDGSADVNAQPDVYLVRLDANGDGELGDLAISPLDPGWPAPLGTHDAVISGNGDVVAYLSRNDPQRHDVTLDQDALYYTAFGGSQRGKLADAVFGRPSIDSTGKAFAYVQDVACGVSSLSSFTGTGAMTVIAAMYAYQTPYSVAMGVVNTDTRVGAVDAPQISADGSSVTWATTVPRYDSSGGGVIPSPLVQPVVRTQSVGWSDADTPSVSDTDVRQGIGACFDGGIHQTEWIDVAPGPAASVSATARTIAYESSAPGRVYAVDRHTHDGISVSSTQGGVLPPAFMTEVAISQISVAALKGYGAVLAGSPVHRLPVHRLPVHRLPVHRLPVHRLLIDDSPVHRLGLAGLPVHRLPVHRLDLPGGWEQILAGTPFAGELLQTVTLAEVLDWADRVLADGSTATDAERAAALLIQSLTLDDIDIDGTGLDALSLASYALGGAPLAQLPLPGADDPATAWTQLLTTQGIDLALDDTTLLADADAAGLDISKTGIEGLVVGALPDDTIDRTLLGWLPLDPTLLPGTPLGDRDVSTLDQTARTALFGDAGVTGTLAEPSIPLQSTATFADLAKGTPDLVFGDLLFSLLDTASYPWEQIAPSSIDPSAVTSYGPGTNCGGGLKCTYQAPFRFSFDAGPGEPAEFDAPTASLTVPTGTRPNTVYATGSGPGARWSDNAPFQGSYAQDGGLITVPMASTRSGTVFELTAWYSGASSVGDAVASAILTTGDLRATGTLFGEKPLPDWDDPAHNLDANGNWGNGDPVTLHEGTLYYEWISPAWLDNDDETGEPIQGPAGGDADFYAVAPPPAGKRLVISTNANDGQLSLALYTASSTGTSAASLGVPSEGAAPGTFVTEQSSVAGSPAESGGDAGAAVPGQTLVDQAVQRGDGTAEVEAASTDAADGRPLLVRVTSGNGQPSAAMYSLRVRYLDEAAEQVCPAWAPAVPGAAVTPTSDPVTAQTNTLYVIDEARYAATYGEAGLATALAALDDLDGRGVVGDATISGALIAVDASAAVAAARTTLDGNPCSVSARAAYSTAVNEYVDAVVGGERDHIASIVVVGGDDIVPMAPVAQHTSDFTESSHAAELRRAHPLGGLATDPCPVVADGTADPCETPLSAAAARNYVLTDDPYGLARAYQTAGGFLYVPTVALGRLAGTPDDVEDAVARFRSSNGVLPGRSTLTAGYGAWSELPQQLIADLAWRSATDTDLSENGATWNADDLLSALLPADGDAPHLVSVDMHADEQRMLPGIPGAETGQGADSDLVTSGATDASALARSLVFLIGCHAGNALPDAYYGAGTSDWVDVFGKAAGYVGNTGYGLANDTSTALSERLLQLYGDWIGVTVDGRRLSASESLTYAKQSYLGRLGLYAGYDEKVLMQAVYYGLPMYTFGPADGVKEAPVPQIPADLGAFETAGPLASASLHLSPTFTTNTVKDASGRDVAYLTADGEAPAVVPGNPVLPKVVKKLPARDGMTPRGALITSLTSTAVDDVVPAIVDVGVGVPAVGATKSDVAFPSTFANITKQDTPTGPVDLLVVTPGRVESAVRGNGRLEKFTQLGLDIVYGPASATDEAAPRMLTPIASSSQFSVEIDGTGSSVTRAVLLLQRQGESEWKPYEFTKSAGQSWFASFPFDERPYRWIVQAVDEAGNVGIDTGRGRLPVAAASAPDLGDGALAPATVPMGGRLQRAVVVADAVPGETLTGRLSLASTDGVPAEGSAVTVRTGDDGTTRALIDLPFGTPGAYVATLTVCRGTACTTKTLDVTVPLPNTAPTATVRIDSSDDPVTTTSRLTAVAEGADADGDEVVLAYTWTRNGVPVGPGERTLDLAEIGATAGDEIAVTVEPFDQLIVGHAASASVVVTGAPAGPQITVDAENAAGAYAEGTWSPSAVTVTFRCTSGVAVSSCPTPVIVDADTTPEGRVVSGTTTDVQGRSASAELLVKVDMTAPALAPAVTPNPAVVGQPATATPHATDSGSGVASQSCGPPDTSAAGPHSVECEATDAAGNRGTATASYTVTPPEPPRCAGQLDRTALDPVNLDGTSVFPRPSGVTVRFTACDAAGAPIGTKNFVKAVTQVSKTALVAGAKVNETFTPPVSGSADKYSYAKATGIWSGTIQASQLAAGYRYVYRVELRDGTSVTVTFGVR
jgi:hypothetical protein